MERLLDLKFIFLFTKQRNPNPGRPAVRISLFKIPKRSSESAISEILESPESSENFEKINLPQVNIYLVTFLSAYSRPKGQCRKRQEPAQDQ